MTDPESTAAQENVMQTLALFNVDHLVEAVLWCVVANENMAGHH
jgi:hypothetical protein